jgi:hypothetical protein
MSYTAMAQLYVTPNTTTSTDSYVYVSDEVLFVEQDINLVANSNDPDTEASIYLRDEAQLLQGTTGQSTNTGTGIISVYQDSNSDSYDYNFWASPVGNPTAGISAPGSTNTNFGILSFYDPVDPAFTSPTQATQTLVTSGYNGNASPDLRISRRWIYKRLAGPSYSYVGSSNNIQAGLGFTMKGVGVTSHGDPYNEPMNQTYDFRGRPNDGNIDVGVLDGESTLSGNPYPSALDLNLFFNDPDNDEIMSIRYWDEDRSINSHLYVDNKGGYGTWVPGPTPYVNGGSYVPPNFYNYDAAGNQTTDTGIDGIAVRRVFAPIGQGFNIFAEDPLGLYDNTVTYKNAHRVFFKESDPSGNSVFRNPIAGGSTYSNQENDPNGSIGISGSEDPYEGHPPSIRVQTLFGQSHFRELLLTLWPESTDGYDRGLDALHPMDGAKQEAYFPIGDDANFKPYVIQTVPYEYGKRVPLNFQIDIQSPVTIKAGEEINLPSRVYLWDSVGNTYQEITNGNEAQLQLHQGSYENRFFIVFRNGRDQFVDPLTEPFNNRSAEVYNNVDFFQDNVNAQLEVSNPEGYDIKSALIFDMSGKLVLNNQDLGNSTRLTFPTGAFSDGVYIVKLTTTDNIVIDYKMTVYNKR